MIMRRYILNLHLLLIFTLVLVLITGCTKEETRVSGSNTELAIKVNSRAVIGETLNEVTIKSIRIVIINPEIGNYIVINRLINHSNEQPDDFVFHLKEGRYKICVIANETEAMATSLATIAKLSDLDAVTVSTPTQESDLVLFQAVDIMLRPLSSVPEQAQVSVDGGINWVSPPVVNANLERVASKISLSIKKKTGNGDKFDIKKVELINLATNSHLLPDHAYTGELNTEAPFESPSVVSFINDNETKPVFMNHIVPEYLLPSPSSPDNAAALVIIADYTQTGGTTKEVTYMVPVLGKDATNYSLKRNCHYNITATITQSAETFFILNIEYEVQPWTYVGNGSFEAGAVTFSGKWEDDTDMTGNSIAVSNNTSVTYEFTLNFPPGATWMAQLTNFQDFDFDMNNNGIRTGTAAEGVVNKIRVRPHAAVLTNDITTEFYITVFNGIEYVELNLTGSGTGEGNRFIIKQNPN